MGLDNIPRNYPCKKQGTAVMTEDKIDCQATQACGGCPYVTELNKQDKEAMGNPVYGMFGTDCWYRGKYGEYLLRASGYDPEEDRTFYGDSEDGTEKSVQSCIDLADFLESIIEEDADENGVLLGDDDENLIPELKYAEWYLRWAAEHADGLVCWF